jgi:hypothetical protein
MILEFKDGAVRLHNLGHRKFFEAGTYRTDGATRVWSLAGYGLDLRLQPDPWGLTAVDHQGRAFFRFGRDWSPWRGFVSYHLTGNTLSEKPLASYAKDLHAVRSPRGD